MAIREGRWDCPSCGSKGLYGRHLTCEGCGSPRPRGVRFYLSDDAPVVADAARLAAAKAGPDWVCEHCGGSAPATRAECPGCGAPRGSSPTQAVHDYDTAGVPRSGDEPKPGPTPRPAAVAAKPGEKKPEGSAAAGCGGLGCIGLDRHHAGRADHLHPAAALAARPHPERPARRRAPGGPGGHPADGGRVWEVPVTPQQYQRC